mmetsp:Transcript_44027/g.106776  ORF Transcript_44027/g.106776 Transcript_44027/m.106776 type:complete len:116 (+) Transcript_44027:2237-2584(+)
MGGFEVASYRFTLVVILNNSNGWINDATIWKTIGKKGAKTKTEKADTIILGLSLCVYVECRGSLPPWLQVSLCVSPKCLWECTSVHFWDYYSKGSLALSKEKFFDDSRRCRRRKF